MLPPLVNQYVTPGRLATREFHETLMGLYRAILANETAIADLQAAGGHYQTLGPFTMNDLAATASTQLRTIFATGTTAFTLAALDPVAPRAGRVIGITMTSSEARTGGTATARARIAGSALDFDGGSVQLNGTNTQRVAGLVSYAEGVSFNAGNRLGIEVVTSGWGPTTADFVGWLTVKYEPF